MFPLFSARTTHKIRAMVQNFSTQSHFSYRSLATSRQLPKWMPKGIDALAQYDEILAINEAILIGSIKDNAANVFLKTRSNMLQAKIGKDDFKFPIFEVVLKRLLVQLPLKFPYEATDPQHEICKLLQKGDELKQQSIPYKATMNYVLKYLTVMDKYFLQRHPHLTSSFHYDNAAHAYPKLLSLAPNVILLPSFIPVDMSYFLNSRQAPMHLMGIDLSGITHDKSTPYADGFAMKPSEFIWHDAGHIEYMVAADLAYLTSTFKPIERVVHEWQITSRRLSQYLQRLKSNKNLYDATEIILFEILHERGFSYSLSVLKAQLDTPKWTEILKRKFLKGYYENIPQMNLALFEVLESAREDLLEFVKSCRISDQRQYIKNLHAQSAPVRITHQAPVKYGKGYLKHIRIHKDKNYACLLDDKNEEIIIPVSSLILTQIDPIKPSPFDCQTKKKINTLTQHELLLKESINHIEVTHDGNINIIIKNDHRLPLDDFDCAFVPFHALQQKNRQFFELEQVLAAAQSGNQLSYTHQEAQVVYVGKINELDVDKIKIVSDAEQRVIYCNLSDVLIDPVQKEDFPENQCGNTALIKI